MKPFIACHMMASIDGRIDCDMLDNYSGGDCYYDTLDSYNCQAFIEGRVSREKHSALQGRFTASDKTPCGFRVFSDNLEPGDTYAISIDTHGTLLWDDWKVGGKTLICIVSEDAPIDYWKYIRGLGAYYIAVGKGRVDLPRAMDILNMKKWKKWLKPRPTLLNQPKAINKAKPLNRRFVKPSINERMKMKNFIS